MGNSNPENVAIERIKSEDEDLREKAGRVSPGKGGRKVNGFAFMGTHRRPAQPEATTGERSFGARSLIPAGRGKVDLGEQIGRELQALYDDVVAQPIPDRFLELLNRLEKKAIFPEAKAKSPGKR